VREHPAAFADSIVRLLKDPALRRGLVANGVQRSHAVDWHVIGTRLREIYARRLDGDWRAPVPVVSEEISFSGRS
jgi:hypothetical protein